MQPDAVPRFTPDSRVPIQPFSRETAGPQAVIGIPARGVYLVVPPEVLEILDALAGGKTIGETAAAFEAAHGEVPDLEDLLACLAEKGFLDGERPDPSQQAAAGKQRFHFTGISQRFAAALFGPSTVWGCCALIALACAALVRDPGLLPGWRALLFTRNLTLASVAVTAFYCLVLFNHEMAHLLAARALGISSRMGIGHRLWTLVAETDLSGLWAVPRNRRYLPLLAGPLVDASCASLLVLLLAARAHGLLSLPPGAVELIDAALLIYLLSLLWQCFFFVRTDLYYVIANYFQCANLLGDTEGWLRNRCSRWLKAISPADQSAISAAEMRVIRAYAVVWVTGRLVALWALLTIHIPLVLGYCKLLAGRLRAISHSRFYDYADSLIMATLWILPLLVGMSLWLRSARNSLRRSLAHRGLPEQPGSVVGE